MKYFLSCLIISILGVTVSRAERPKHLSFPSPDGKWSIEAQWLKHGDKDLGYQPWLMNKASGRIYFKYGKAENDDLFPRYFDALWSKDSKYVATNQYFGRAMAQISVFCVGTMEPLLLAGRDIPEIDPMAMIKPVDKRFYPWWNQNKVWAEKWLNDIDLFISQFARFLKKDANDGTVDCDYHYVLRFKNGKATIIKQDKLPVDYN